MTRYEGGAGDDKATEALYKLESLRKVGGLRTRAMVLDYRGALSAHAPNRDRARSAGIEIVAGRQLGDLRGCIQRAWLGGLQQFQQHATRDAGEVAIPRQQRQAIA